MQTCALETPLRATYSTKFKDTSCQRFYDKKRQTHDCVVIDDCEADCIAHGLVASYSLFLVSKYEICGIERYLCTSLLRAVL